MLFIYANVLFQLTYSRNVLQDNLRKYTLYNVE